MAQLTIRMVPALAANCAALGLGFTALTAPAVAQQSLKAYAISRQDLGVALRAFAIVSGKDVVFDPMLVKGKRTHGVQGQYGDDDALRRILAGTGLVFARTGAGGFVVRPDQPTPAPPPEQSSS